jgi:CheY-like chemotaxis protein
MRGILLAEDNPADVYLIREALRECGVECPLRVASDGGDVMRMIDDRSGEGRHFGLIILDLNLPRHDGIEILERLRENPDFGRIPVAVLTSSDSPRDRTIAAQLGAACFLRKPSNLEEFLDLGSVFKNLLEQFEEAGHANTSSD